MPPRACTPFPLIQGRATVDRLQAEANRLSAEVGNTAAPIADKLSTGVSSLPEVSLSAGSSAGSRLSQLSGSLAATLSASVRSVAVQVGTVKDSVTGVTADLGSTAAERFTGALGRGAEKVLPAVGEARRVVEDGASTLSKAAAGGLPVVQEQTSALSSQVGLAVGGAGKTLNQGVSKLSHNAAEGLPVVQDQVSALTSQVSGLLLTQGMMSSFRRDEGENRVSSPDFVFLARRVCRSLDAGACAPKRAELCGSVGV